MCIFLVITINLRVLPGEMENDDHMVNSRKPFCRGNEYTIERLSHMTELSAHKCCQTVYPKQPQF